MSTRGDSRRRGSPAPWAAALALSVASAAAPAADGIAAIYHRALTEDQTYVAAGAAARAAREAAPQARAAMLPSLNAGASVTALSRNLQRSISPIAQLGRTHYNTSSVDLTLTQPIYRRDLWIALAQADRQVAKSEAQFALAGQDLILRVADRYFGMLRSLDELAFSRAVRAAYDEQLKQAEQRFDVGLIAITDVEEARAGADLATANIITAENQLDSARELLREITGRFPTEIAALGPKMPLEPPDPDDVEAWTRRALEQNLAVAAAGYNVEIASEEIERVAAGHLPTLDLVGSHTRDYASAGTGTRTWTSALGLELNVPIYQGGLVMSRSRQSRELHREAVATLERERRSTERQTRDAFLNVKAGIARVGALEQAVRSNKSAADAVDAGFQVGTRTSVDVLDARRALLQAERDLSAARYEYLLGVLRLKQAAGTLSGTDIERVDGWLER